MKNLLFSIALLAILSGCSPSVTPAGSAETTVFGNSGRHLYSTSVNLYSNNLTGLTYIRPSGESCRVLFITELGMKIFDVELFRNSAPRMHYCMSDLNRPSVTKLIGNDLHLMVFPVGNLTRRVSASRNDGETTIVVSSDETGKRKALLNTVTGQPFRVVKRVFPGKVKVDYFNNAMLPDSMKISHTFVKFKISFNRLNNDE